MKRLTIAEAYNNGNSLVKCFELIEERLSSIENKKEKDIVELNKVSEEKIISLSNEIIELKNELCRLSSYIIELQDANKFKKKNKKDIKK